MAEENDDLETPVVEKSSSGNKNLIIIIVIVILALAVSIGGTLYALGFFDSDEADQVDTAEDPVAEVIDKPAQAIYFPIKPAFIINFPDKGRQRYLQVDVTVQTRDIAIFDAMQKHMPLIKNRLNMLMSGEIYEELQTAEGKELMRQKALQALQDIMQAEVGKDGVEEVLFTNFVMQ